VTPERLYPDRIAALLGAELRALVREPKALAALVLLLVAVGALGPAGGLFVAYMEERYDTPAAAGPLPTFDCQPGAMAAVAVVGDVPAWLDWPDPFVPAPSAGVLLRFGPLTDARQDIEAVGLDPQASSEPVMDCLRDRLRTERRTRLSALGIPEELRSIIAVDTLVSGRVGQAEVEPPGAGWAVAGGLALLLASVFLELAPRARASGWLESWLVLPGPRADLIVAWWLLGALVATVGTVLVLVGDALGGLATGVHTAAAPWGLLPVLVAVVSATGVRAFLDVADMRTAMVKAVPVVLAFSLLVGVAHLLEGEAPGLGGLVPLGGLVLAIGGGTDGHALAAVTGLAAAALLLLDSVRVLDGLGVRDEVMGRTAARRARGDYVPEAVLLALIAFAGVGSWAPPAMLMKDLATRTGVSMGVFLLLPALAVSVPLRLDRAELLSWRAPPRRAWLLLPAIVAGTLSLGGLLWRQATAWFPHDRLVTPFLDTIEALDTPAGLVALTLAPGVCEELLFRGALLGLLRRRLPLWGAILAQAVAFSLLHASATRLPHTLALGVVYGLLTVRTRSLWPAIAAHVAHNLLSLRLGAELEVWISHPAAWAVAAIGVLAAWGAGPGRSR
jgi:membrane protease YdiL (CAAX protease family)